MFRLESYITPIILNHVDKYVKNIRPQDAQVSLWEGEVAFQNLDLRLDVLEEELNLPFEFLSGHIHELIIHVPWTKINSEPINITINTIEFVLKLKDLDQKETGNSSTNNLCSQYVEKKKKTSRIEDSQPGYNASGLVNKIINNITINCHNIILKYVEEDIVVSMNVQLLCLHSAAEDWNKAFIDIHPINRIIRKVVEISDLTICLDKRNSKGQIEVCQEPILYKCSLQIRLILKSMNGNKETKIGILTNLIDMNISSFQFPMAVRLFNLMLALKSGDLTTHPDLDEISDGNEEGNSILNESNWTSAIWNMLPNLFDSEVDDKNKTEEIVKNILDIGLYVENFKFTLKSSEFINESVVGTTKRIRYNPIVTLLLSGIYSEVVIDDRNNWFSSKTGISKISVEPLGNFCEELSDKFLLKSDNITQGNFIFESMFDNSFELNDPITNITEYLHKNTETYLNHKTPCFNFSIIKYRKQTENNDSINGLDDIIYQLYINGITIRYNTEADKIINTISTLIAMYDYPPYTSNISETDVKLAPPSLEDYESLIIEVPVKIFYFNIQNIILKIFPREELYIKHENKIKIIEKISKKFKGKLPHFLINIQMCNGKRILPQNPELLVNTTSQLPNPPTELLNACYEQIFINIKEVSISLNDNNTSYPLLIIPMGNADISKILFPILWQNHDLDELKFKLKIQDFIIRLTMPRLILSLKLIKTILSFNYITLIDIVESSTRIDIHNLDLPELENFGKFLEINFKIFEHLIFTNGNLGSFRSSLVTKCNKIILLECNQNNLNIMNKSNTSWFEWSIQFPKNVEYNGYLTVVFLNVQIYSIFLNKAFIEFLKYTEGKLIIEEVIAAEKEIKFGSEKYTDRKGAKKSVASSSRKITQPEETIHLSSDKGQTIDNVNLKETQKTTNVSNRKIFCVLKQAVLNLNINQGTISFLVDDLINTNVDYETATLWLPQIVCKSFSSENFNFNQNVPIKNILNLRESFPWTCDITSLSISFKTKEGTVYTILHPVQTNITISMTHKIETVSVSNVLFLKAVDQIQDRFDKKSFNYENITKKKNELTESEIDEDHQSMDCDLSNKEYHTDFTHRKNQVEKDINNHDNIVHTTVPCNSPKQLDKNEINDSEIIKNIETQKAEKDIIAFNFHIDTSPIFVELNTNQVNILQYKIDILFKTLELLSIMDSYSSNTNENYRIVSDFDDNATVKEFLEMDSCSDYSSRFILDHNNLIISTWLQWTITKMCMNVENKTNLKIELEDFIVSLDKQIDYIKIKSKFQTLSMQHFKRNESKEIVIDKSLKFHMKTNNSDLPFIDITVTIADTKSVFKKIGAHKKADLNNKLYEIIITMQAFEITVNLDELLEFMPIICALTTNTDINDNFEKNNQNKAKTKSGSQLPLVYFNLNGFTIYLPVKDESIYYSVFILNVNEVRLSPNVKNPLTRKPIRSDMFNKAAQMGLLNIRGSIIEDRQYELRICNISMTSGNWNDLLSHMEEHENILRNTNPAFVWNHQNITKDPLELQEIFKNFDVSITYAPNIVYQKILVCGKSIEINCVTDLNAKVTTKQIKLLSCISVILQNLFVFREHYEKSISSKNENIICNKSTLLILKENISSEFSIFSGESKSKRKTLMDEITGEGYSDSGFSTYEKVKRIYIKKGESKSYSDENNKYIPYEISFLAGLFTIDIYYSKNQRTSLKTKSKPTSLLLCTFNQPSMLICQKVYEKFVQFSLYDLKINISHYARNNKFTKKSTMNIFDTLPGKLNISGIPPSLFSLKINLNKLQKRNIKCFFSKPIKINLQHTVIERLANIWVILFKCTKSSLSHRHNYPKEITRGTKLKIIKKNLANADTLIINLDQLIIKSTENEKNVVEITLDNFRSAMHFTLRPEKLNFDLSLDTFYIKTENKICLHPLSMNCNFSLVQEKWSTLPLIKSNLNFNVIQIDIGIDNLKNILTIVNSFQESIHKVEKVLQHLEKEIKELYRTDEIENQNFNNYTELLPKLSQENELKSKAEFYQDDLRAGAFQFVEINDDSSLPLPYQIHIITKNHGIICWRYPQPRKICKLHIFPIPMPTTYPIEIKCQIEYFSELHNKFLPFSHFTLSEIQTTEIELPKRTITANIWRVNILQPLVSINREYFDTSEEDEEVKQIKFDDFNATDDLYSTLNPKVLVGCMKIDTCFLEDDIPKFELLCDIAYFELNLQNQENISYKSGILSEFQKSKDVLAETFLLLKFKNIKLLTKILSSSSYSIDSELNLSIKVLDYSFSNMQVLMDETNFKNYLVVKKNSVLFNFTADAIKIKLDPSVLHTLVVSTRHWNEQIMAKSDDFINPVITRFILVNTTQFSIFFGQTSINDKVHISPKEFVAYSLLTDLAEPSLTFYNPDNLTESSEPLYLTVENLTHHLKVGERIYIIELEKLSYTQIIIFVKGQVEFLVNVAERFKIQFKHQNIDGTYTTKSPEYQLIKSYRTSFCHDIFNTSLGTFRIKFESNQIKLWSGDIPLRSNKNLPWLVKVPLSGTNDFISYWIRIINEEIVDFKTTLHTPIRVLIIIWPIYQVKSMFPRKILFTESFTNTELEINGRGGVLDLRVPATHETEHMIKFTENFVNSKGEKYQTCNLSLKTIDWNQFFTYDCKKWTINKCLSELQQTPDNFWPYDSEEECKIHRKCKNNKQSTIPLMKIIPSREFSCTLLLEVAPWCIFINSLNTSIKLQCTKTGNNLHLSSNELSILFPVESAFTIEIECNSGWMKSLPIYFHNILHTENKKSDILTIKDECEIEMIFSGNIIHKTILKSVIENGRKVLILKPVFILVNYSDTDLYYIPFCIQYNHKITREEIRSLTSEHGILIEKQNKVSNGTGLAVDAFLNLSANKQTRNKELYHFCVTLYAEGSEEVTTPIFLSKVFNRKCISLQQNNDSIALSVNCLEKDCQYYINIFNDLLPMLQIRNCTDLNFLIAQTDSNENDDVIVKPECEAYNFEWYQILKRTSTLYYTPPDAYLNFPDNGNISCNIILAFFNEPSLDRGKNIRWSKPLRINVNCEKFFNIPMFGDVKITVCDKHKITKLFISYIAEKLEFSVKDLRSRLSSPANSFSENEKDIIGKSEELEKQKSQQAIISPSSCTKCNHEIISNGTLNIDVNIFVKEIIVGIATIYEKKKFEKSEVLAVYVDDIITKYDNQSKIMKLVISNLQIDNQLFSTCKYDFPVILCAQKVYSQTPQIPSIYDLNEEASRYEESALINLTLQFRKDNELFEVYSILCKIQPIRTYMEDTYLNYLLEFFTECNIENLVLCPKDNKEKRILSKGQIIVPDQIKNRASYLAEPLRLDFFRIEPLSVMFSVHTCTRFYIALDHSSLQLAAFERRNITTLPIRLGYTVGMHYLSGALFGAGWVVGSLEILGSPSGLARSFTIGFKDFITLPLEGFFRGPWGFIIGITQGSVSLLRNVTAGTVNSVTKLASSVARNIDRLTFDEEHFQRTELIRRTRPQGFAAGLSQGLTNLGINILGAVGGLARHPLEAQSPAQIVTGVGKGIVGAITKPISGAAELVALTGHGVLHSVGFNTQPKQRSSIHINNDLYKSPAKTKFWKLLPEALQLDQILFFHEATLVFENKMKGVIICMTSTVLAIFELDENKLLYVLPVDRVIASFDENDSTLINVNLKPKNEVVDEYMNKQFAKRRILDFLSSSRALNSSKKLTNSLENLLIDDKLSTKVDWSFYICENMGRHFLQYLKIISPYPVIELKK